MRKQLLFIFIFTFSIFTGCSSSMNCAQHSSHVHNMEKCMGEKIEKELNAYGLTTFRPLVIGSLPENKQAQPLVEFSQPSSTRQPEPNMGNRVRINDSARQDLNTMCRGLNENYDRVLKQNKSKRVIGYSLKELEECLAEQSSLKKLDN